MLYRVEGHLEKAVEVYRKLEHMFRRKKNMGMLANTFFEHGALLWMQGLNLDAQRILSKGYRVCPVSEGKLQGNILNVMGLSLQNAGDLRKAKFYLSKAYRAAEQAGDRRHIIVRGLNLWTVYSQGGETRRAFQSMVPLLNMIGDNYSLRIGMAFVIVARAAIEFGKIEYAKDCLDRGWKLCQGYNDPWSEGPLYHGCGYLSLHKGQWDEARQYLEKAQSEFVKLRWLNMEYAVLRDLARLARYTKEFDKAAQILESMRQRTMGIEGFMGAAFLIEKSLLEYARGQYKQAQKTSSLSLRLSGTLQWKTGEFLSCLTKTGSYGAQGNAAKALSFYRRAIRLARSKGYDGILLCELRHNPGLMDFVRKYDIEKRYLSSLSLPVVSDQSDIQKDVLKLQFFGKFEIHVEHVSSTSRLKRRTTRAILAYFLLHPRRKVTWEEVTAWVWPESPAPTAHQMFKIALWEIRKCHPLLRKVIIYTDRYYYLNPDISLWVDVWVFQNMLGQVSIARKEVERLNILQEVVNLYKGTLLAGYNYSWVNDLQSYYEIQYIQALGSLAEIYFKQGKYKKSISCCLEYLAVDEISERIHHLLIANFARLGMKSKAIEHYEKLKIILHKKLKTKPSSETYALVQSIR
jgi:two-component SAPR family response regulator